MLRGRALTARVRSGEEGGNDQIELMLYRRRLCGKEAELTCNIDVGRGGVEGCRSPCSAAVAWSDAYDGGENEMSVICSTFPQF